MMYITGEKIMKGEHVKLQLATPTTVTLEHRIRQNHPSRVIEANLTEENIRHAAKNRRMTYVSPLTSASMAPGGCR
jgi:hypothetical protein